MAITFRIHNPKKRSDRVLIKVTSIRPSVEPVPIAALPGIVAPVPEPVGTTMSVKSKKKISIKQLQEILKLVQKSKNRDLLKLLSSSLEGLVDEDADVDIDDVDEAQEDNEEEVKVEEVTHVEDNEEEDDEDVLVIEI